MPDHAVLYRDSRQRIAALVRETSEEERARTVPGCPKWTVSDTVAHLAANAVDEAMGRLAGVPNDEQTAAQVDQRRGRPLEEVLAEWDGAAESIEPSIAAHALSIAWVNDVLTHEATSGVPWVPGGPLTRRGPRRWS